MDHHPARGRRGRGAVSNPLSRFESHRRHIFDDGWPGDDDGLASTVRPTRVAPERVARIITRNRSPDVPFEQSVNPYRGCEHGCIYCFARPNHAYVDLSPGLDFETQLFYKTGAAERLDAELRRPGYHCKPITLGTSTDPYQPVERRLGVTRSILEVLARFRHPVTVITKGTLVERDTDILAPMAAQGLAAVMVSLTTLENGIKRTLEPRTAAPKARLRTVRSLSEAGIPVGVLAAPIVPGINDHELEHIIAAAADAGAVSAGYILLRLPREVAPLFREWLQAHYPERAGRVMARIRQAREGRDYQAAFGTRMRGTGPYANLLERRFRIAARKHGLDGERPPLRTDRFTVPQPSNGQLRLLD